MFLRPVSESRAREDARSTQLSSVILSDRIVGTGRQIGTDVGHVDRLRFGGRSHARGAF